MTILKESELENECFSIERNMCKIQEDSYLTINYKKIKKKSKSFNPRVISNFNMILIVSIFLSETVASEDYSLHRCDAPTQQNIFENLPQCMPRPRLVDMRKHFTHHHDIIQVVPDHVMVDRCGGSCYMESYNCIPEATSMTKVQVMLVQSKFPHGKHDTMCSEVEVEVHNSCKCGCKTKREHCNRLQYYHEQSCRCICDNTEERSACIAADKVWDPDTCQCHCPIHTIQPCSTCYMFDLSTCKCVLICGEAGWGLIAASLVLFFLSVTIIISL